MSNNTRKVQLASSNSDDDALDAMYSMQVDELQRDTDQLKDELNDLHRQCDHLERENDQLQRDIDELEAFPRTPEGQNQGIGDSPQNSQDPESAIADEHNLQQLSVQSDKISKLNMDLNQPILKRENYQLQHEIDELEAVHPTPEGQNQGIGDYSQYPESAIVDEHNRQQLSVQTDKISKLNIDLNQPIFEDDEDIQDRVQFDTASSCKEPTQPPSVHSDKIWKLNLDLNQPIFEDDDEDTQDQDQFGSASTFKEPMQQSRDKGGRRKKITWIRQKKKKG